MQQSARRTLQPEAPARSRRDDLIRPPEVRRAFPVREAQRHLREKERNWTPIAYAVFLAAAAFIFFSAYTAYAFSRYKDVILPGVHVDVVSLSGLTQKQAITRIGLQLGAIYHKPVTLAYNGQTWAPKSTDMGLRYRVDETVQLAQEVGRNEGFLPELVDRMPIHPSHAVPLLYQLNQTTLTQYLRNTIGVHLSKQQLNAQLQPTSTGHIRLIPSQQGVRLDVPRSEAAIRQALGYLTRHTVNLQIDHLPPVITDQAAQQVQQRVERFLASPPVIKLGKTRIVTSRTDFAPMLAFNNKVQGPKKATIEMVVKENVVRAYIAKLAAGIDRPAVNAKMQFTAGRVQVIVPRKTGRQVDQAAAFTSLTHAISTLHPNQHLAFTVKVLQPPTDLSNPASLGITQLVGYGETSFAGSGRTRLDDIAAIAQQLDGDLLPPGQPVSFNALAGTAWDPRVYQDEEVERQGQLVPGPGGAMQQVATTFLRALYQSGLKLDQRYAHTHRLGWYEPPVGLDAVVAPDRGWDLVFTNNTGKYLLIKTRLEPIRQQLFIYVYGPKLGWSVAVDKVGKIVKTIPHGKEIVRQDPSLPPGVRKQTQWPHDGAETVVQRTITYPNGRVSVDQITTNYQPWQAIVLVGAGTSATPTPSAKSGNSASPHPTATFSH